MKNFLLTQSTEYDCGPVTLVNAMRFLFEREEIPPALIRAIWLYANDTYNEQGQKGTRGTFQGMHPLSWTLVYRIWQELQFPHPC